MILIWLAFIWFNRKWIKRSSSESNEATKKKKKEKKEGLHAGFKLWEAVNVPAYLQGPFITSENSLALLNVKDTYSHRKRNSSHRSFSNGIRQE